MPREVDLSLQCTVSACQTLLLTRIYWHMYSLQVYLLEQYMHLMESGHDGSLSFQEDSKFLLNNLSCDCDGYHNRLKQTAGYSNDDDFRGLLGKEILFPWLCFPNDNEMNINHAWNLTPQPQSTHMGPIFTALNFYFPISSSMYLNLL